VTLSPVLARLLAAGRPQFNARVAAARRGQPGFDAEALAEALRSRLDPVIVAVEIAAPDRVAAVLDAGFDVILGLVGQGIAGERAALIDHVWRRLAVAHAACVAERPFEVLGMLTNAALTLAGTRGARAEEWIERMEAIASLVSADTLAPAGQVVAWRCGMAHFREGAIAAADGLPAPLAAAAIGVCGEWADIREAIVADPWWTPPGEAAPSVLFGEFTGFGGPFPEPPSVRPSPNGFLIRSGSATGLLVANAWGATLHPAEASEFETAASGPPVLIEGALVEAGDRRISTDFPSDGLAAVANANSVAIFSRYSHEIRVEPWRRL
jgi:hypothetical protein